jgi:hypothetical protein
MLILYLICFCMVLALLFEFSLHNLLMYIVGRATRIDGSSVLSYHLHVIFFISDYFFVVISTDFHREVD